MGEDEKSLLVCVALTRSTKSAEDEFVGVVDFLLVQ